MARIIKPIWGPQGPPGEPGGPQGPQGTQGPPGTGGSSIIIDAPGHLFAVGDIVGFNGTDWFLASADNSDNAEAVQFRNDG